MRKTITLRALGAAAVLALGMSVSGCHTGGRTTGQAINDKMTAYDVNRALDNDPVLKYPDVKVSVFNGTAQLTGFVNTEQQRNEAAQIASNVQGVHQVINEITIRPQPTGRAEIRNMQPGPSEPPPAH
jgi:hyperosmotically inducible protein